MTDEPINEKIDRLNLVIGQLMNDLDINNDHLKVSILNSVQNSICENSFMQDMESNNDLGDYFVPQEFIEKFQETLTLCDRLGMQIEDLKCQIRNNEEKLFEIFISTDQLKALENKIQEVLSNSEPSFLFKMTRNSLEFFDLKLVNSDLFNQLRDLSIENLKLKNSVYENSTRSPRRRSSKINEKLNQNIEQDYSQKIINLERKTIELCTKEQDLDKLKEEYGFMISKAEVLISEYEKKLESLNKKFKNVKISSSQDFTRTRTPANISFPLSSSLFITSFFQYKQQIEEKLKNFEEVLKNKYRKKNRKRNEIPNIFIEFKKREDEFLDKVRRNKEKSKEMLFNEYLVENREFLKTKIQELENYQNFLMETWAKTNGEHQGIDAIKKCTSTYFSKLLSSKSDREQIQDLYYRNKKIEENIKDEVKKLQQHRKKILFERQHLQNQLHQMEKYLKIIANLNRISI